MIKEIWAYIGPLVGLLIGAFLQSNSQRKQWRRDNIKQECKDVIDALVKFRFALWEYHWSDRDLSTDIGKEYKRALYELQQVLVDRLLSYWDIHNANMPATLDGALTAYKRSNNHDALRDTLLDLQALVVKKGLAV